MPGGNNKVFRERAVGVVCLLHNGWLLDEAKKIAQFVSDYTKAYGAETRIRLFPTTNYIMVHVESTKDVGIALVSRLLDIPLVYQGSVLTRRKADDIISRYGVAGYPVLKRAPSGGVTVWLLRYKGGQYLPQRILKPATG